MKEGLDLDRVRRLLRDLRLSYKELSEECRSVVREELTAGAILAQSPADPHRTVAEVCSRPMSRVRASSCR